VNIGPEPSPVRIQAINESVLREVSDAFKPLLDEIKALRLELGDFQSDMATLKRLLRKK
jgi:hypothetical protein